MNVTIFKTYLHKYSQKLSLSFLLIVCLPSIVSVVYFGLWASDRYVSESKFVIRSPQKNTVLTGVSALLQGAGFSRAQDDTYIVHQYIQSRDAMLDLDHQLQIKDKYASSSIDIFSRFNPLGLDSSYENFYKYYKDKVLVDLDGTSSITTLTVKAYTSEQALKINEHLLELAEKSVNQLNERGRNDLLASAQQEVRDAEERVKDVAASMSKFRSQSGIFDVEKQATIKMQLISKLQDQLITVETQLTQVRAITPLNPQINVLESRRKSIKQEIDKETKSIVGVGVGSMNNNATEYEKLLLEKDFASKQLTVAMSSLEQQKMEADKKQLYLERVSQPQKPDMAAEPARIRDILSVLLLSLVLWGVFKMVYAGVKEHQE